MEYDVFVCYKKYSARDLAEQLKMALGDYGISAFVDFLDIPKEFESTAKWWQYRDQAISDCNTFLMIVTKGFERSSEISEEIKLAREQKRNFMCFRWKNLEPKILVDLGGQLFNLQDQQQITFDTPEGLVRAFFDNYPKYGQKTEKEATSRMPLSQLPSKDARTPLVHFEITQAVRNTGIERSLPDVGFNIRSWNDFPVRARVKARVFLGGRDLGLVKGSHRGGKYMGYYDGKTPWNLNPYTLFFGHFSIPKECVESVEEDLTVEVSVVLEDKNGILYDYLPVGWTYIRAHNVWFAEPRGGF